MAKEATFSIADLNLETAGEKPYEFEFTNSKGEGTGILLSVLSDESETVKAATNKLMDERRRKDAIAAVNVRPGRPAPITHAEDDIAFGKKLAAVRLVGWKGILEPYSPELALTLVTTNSEIAAQVMTESGKIGNFTKL